MKQKLLSVIAFLGISTAAFAAVGDDVTSTYLKNADFSAGQPVSGFICTYDYDMETNSATMFGMQPVTEWVASSPSDNTLLDGRTDNANAKAAGVFAIASEDSYLGGTAYLAPSFAPDESVEGQVLGFVAVWGARAQYTQAVSLPAGAYRIIIPAYNAGGATAISSNLCGFETSDGTQYFSKKLTWTEGEWENDTIEFLLSEAAEGVISVGYVAGNAGSAGMPHLFYNQVIIQEGDAQALIQIEIDAAKERLLAVITDGEEIGVNTSAAQEVYDNPAATLQEVEAAILSQKDINEKGLTDFTDFFINNAHFSNGTPLDGGVCTYDYDIETHQDKGALYYGMQEVDSWIPSNTNENARASGVFAVGSPETIWLGGPGYATPEKKANGSSTGNIFGFVSVWTASSSYTQNVTLPAGTYTITIPTYNGGGTGNIAKNLCGFISADGDEYLATTTSFPVGEWKEETIRFTLDEETAGVISIGYTAANAGSGSMPHLWIDEFLLKFSGVTEIKPSLIALQSAVRSAESYTTFDDGQYEATLKTKVEEAFAAAIDLVNASSEDDDANVAATTALNNIVSEARVSRAKYVEFYTFINGALTEAIEQYFDQPNFESLVSSLEELEDEYNTAYEEGSYTTEQINEAISGLNTTIKDAVKAVFDQAVASGEKLANPIDITSLYEEMTIPYTTSQAAYSGSIWKNETGTGNFKTNYSTAEVWNASPFNIYRELTDMPKGKYTITVKAFYRTADQQTNYDNYQLEQTDLAFVYGGYSKSPLLNIVEFASQDSTAYTDVSKIVTETGSLFVPNSQLAAHNVFEADEDKVTLSTVSTALGQNGTLTFGIKSEQMEANSWVVWADFRLYYNAADASDLNPEIEGLIEVATAQLDNTGGVLAAENGLQQAIETGNAAIEADDEASKLSAIDALNAAIAYAKESVTLAAEFAEILQSYNDRLDLSMIESEDESFYALLEEIANQSENGDYFDSNEQITTWIKQMREGWVIYVLGQDLSEASLDNPVDVTEALVNPDFSEDNHTNGWIIETEATSGNRGTYENGFLEFWNVNAGWTIYQELPTLKAGYYSLVVEGLYRPVGMDAVVDSLNNGSAIAQHVYIFAGDSKTPIMSWADTENGAYLNSPVPEGVTYAEKILASNDTLYAPNTRAQLASFTAEGRYLNTFNFKYEDGQGAIRLGLLQNTLNAGDWAPFGNIQLYYIGTEEPDAVKSVEAADVLAAGKNDIYNLAGQRVSKAKKGLYIIGGRKVVVK
ncbi:MAG: hypothetical protein K6F94_02995 [Bacteroidaceae bacterium]|nr:hypothetical protein [Bacteroidaceae bacterium]